jgi:hypothetical protein
MPCGLVGVNILGKHTASIFSSHSITTRNINIDNSVVFEFGQILSAHFSEEFYAPLHVTDLHVHLLQS